MKTDCLHLPSDSRVGNTHTVDAGHADYVSLEAARGLLSSSLAARSARLAANDRVSTDEAAELAGTSPVTVNAWIAKGRCIGLSQTKRGCRLSDGSSSR